MSEMTEDGYWNAATDEDRHALFMTLLAEVERLRGTTADKIEQLRTTIDGLREQRAALAAVIAAFDRGFERGGWMSNLARAIDAARKLLQD